MDIGPLYFYCDEEGRLQLVRLIRVSIGRELTVRNADHQPDIARIEVDERRKPVFAWTDPLSGMRSKSSLA
jgi:hypothetical protein